MKAEAIALHRQGAYKAAIALYGEVLQELPQDIDALANLGCAYRAVKQPEVAVILHRQALEISPGHTGLRFNLANALKDLHRYSEAIELYLELLREDPEKKEWLFNLAIAYRDRGDHARALDILRSLHHQFPNEQSVCWEMAQNCLRMGDYSNGWRYFESRWNIGKISLPKLDVPIWNGEDLKGKHLFVVAEQGYGDTMLVARFIPLLMAAAKTVTLLCKTELHVLFQESGIRCAANADDVSSADYLIPLMSVPRLLDPDNENLPPPYRPFVSDERIEHFRWRLSPSTDRPNVGIVWSGSVTFQNNHNRAMELTRMLRLLAPFDIKLYSFQKGAPAKQLQHMNAGNAIADAGRLCRDFAETAAALQSMDFIVMTDSSVAHLAAGLGKPVVNLLDYQSYWIYGAKGSKTPWYPTMHLVRQQIPGVWDSVVPQMDEVVRCVLMS